MIKMIKFNVEILNQTLRTELLAEFSIDARALNIAHGPVLDQREPY